MRKKLRLIPYWLRGHGSVCSACHRRQAHSVERRCVACDEILCSFCALLHKDEPFCPQCHEQEVR